MYLVSTFTSNRENPDVFWILSKIVQQQSYLSRLRVCSRIILSFSCARVGHFVFRWTLITGEPHERHKLKISCRSGVCLSLHILSMLVTIIITKVYMCHYKSFQMTGSHRTNDSQARSSDQ